MVPMAFERVGPDDLTILATDKGQVPMNIGAVLVFGSGWDALVVGQELADRLAGIRRFRQRLVRPGLAAGAPVWVDDPDFRAADHLGATDLLGAGDLLNRAADLVCTRLPMSRPLWRMHVFQGLPAGGFAVVMVVHHVLADGMGGLAVLAALADGVPTAPWSPQPGPTTRELRRDAHRRRIAALRSSRATLRTLGQGLREMGFGRQRPSQVVPSSLLRPTSPRRTVRTVTVPLAPVVDAAHRHGATVNDVVLAGVAGTLFKVLAGRGESPGDVVISVPVSARSAGTELGNRVGAVPVAVPDIADPVARLRWILRRTQQAKSAQRGSSAIVLSWLFRILATLGVGQWFVDHQRLVHSFETNLRGPAEVLRLAGAQVEQIVPIAVNPGNVGLSFDVLSYAGGLTVALVADPEVVPEVAAVAQMLGEELATLTGTS